MATPRSKQHYYIVVDSYGENKKTIQLTLPKTVGNLHKYCSENINLDKYVRDVKHSDHSDCSCGVPSQQVMFSMGAWLEVGIINIHSTPYCNLSTPCAKTLADEANAIAAQSGQPPSAVWQGGRNPDRADGKFPLNKSCVGCQADETAKKTMSMCGGCYCVKYCSQACQTADRNRHKNFCKYVTYVGVKQADGSTKSMKGTEVALM